MEFPKIEVVKEGKDQILVIKARIPAAKDFEVSGSGKSIMVATTSGNKKCGVKINDQELTVGLNAYIKNPDFKEPKNKK